MNGGFEVGIFLLPPRTQEKFRLAWCSAKRMADKPAFDKSSDSASAFANPPPHCMLCRAGATADRCATPDKSAGKFWFGRMESNHGLHGLHGFRHKKAQKRFFLATEDTESTEIFLDTYKEFEVKKQNVLFLNFLL